MLTAAAAAQAQVPAAAPEGVLNLSAQATVEAPQDWMTLVLSATFGRFDSEPVIKLWGGYRLSDTLSVELASSQVQGVYAGTSLWHVALLTEPWFKQRLSPFFGVGIGRFHNVPNKSLIDAHTTDANLGMVTLGVKYHLSERFVARLDYELTTAFLSDEKTSDYGAYSAGLSFFF